MNRESNPVAPRPLVNAAAALAAMVIAAGILGGVGTLFQSRGTPLATVAAAERACEHQAYASDRKACMKRWTVASRTIAVAAR